MQRSQRQRNAYSWVGDIDLLVPKFHRKIQAFSHIHEFLHPNVHEPNITCQHNAKQHFTGHLIIASQSGSCMNLSLLSFHLELTVWQSWSPKVLQNVFASRLYTYFPNQLIWTKRWRHWELHKGVYKWLWLLSLQESISATYTVDLFDENIVRRLWDMQPQLIAWRPYSIQAQSILHALPYSLIKVAKPLQSLFGAGIIKDLQVGLDKKKTMDILHRNNNILNIAQQECSDNVTVCVHVYACCSTSWDMSTLRPCALQQNLEITYLVCAVIIVRPSCSQPKKQIIRSSCFGVCIESRKQTGQLQQSCYSTSTVVTANW